MTARSHQLSRRRLCQTGFVAGGLLVGGTAPAAATDDASTRWLSWSPPGYVADEVEFGGDRPETVEQRVADQLPDVEPAAVLTQQKPGELGTIELLSSAVTESAFRSAIETTGYSYGSIYAGASQQTHDEIIEVLGTRLNEAGIAATVYEATADGEQYILVKLSESDESTAQELLSSRGAVSIDIYHEDGGAYTSESALTSTDFQSVGSASRGDRSGPHVPVTVRATAAEQFQQRLVETGVAQEGGSQCMYGQDPDSTEPCLLLVSDGDVRNAFGMAPGLADTMRDGTWAEERSFILTTASLEAAQQVSVFLRSGALPVELSIAASDEPPVAESYLDERETAGTDGGEDGGEDSGETDISAPGFGFGVAAAALGVAGYLFGRQTVETDHQ